MGFSLYGTGDWEEERMREDDLELSVLLDIGTGDWESKRMRQEEEVDQTASEKKKKGIMREEDLE